MRLQKSMAPDSCAALGPVVAAPGRRVQHLGRRPNRVPAHTIFVLCKPKRDPTPLLGGTRNQEIIIGWGKGKSIYMSVRHINSIQFLNILRKYHKIFRYLQVAHGSISDLSNPKGASVKFSYNKLFEARKRYQGLTLSTMGELTDAFSMGGVQRTMPPYKEKDKGCKIRIKIAFHSTWSNTKIIWK